MYTNITRIVVKILRTIRDCGSLLNNDLIAVPIDEIFLKNKNLSEEEIDTLISDMIDKELVAMFNRTEDSEIEIIPQDSVREGDFIAILERGFKFLKRSKEFEGIEEHFIPLVNNDLNELLGLPEEDIKEILWDLYENGDAKFVKQNETGDYDFIKPDNKEEINYNDPDMFYFLTMVDLIKLKMFNEDDDY